MLLCQWCSCKEPTGSFVLYYCSLLSYKCPGPAKTLRKRRPPNDWTQVFTQADHALVSILLATGVCRGQEPAPTASPTPVPAQPATETAAPAVANTAKPKIYFYRIKQFTGSALEPSVFCDDKELARMDNGRYFVVTLEPGKHTCRMGDKQTGFEIDMKPGEEYYARITIDMGFLKGRGRLTLLAKEQGAFELKKVKLLAADKVKDRTLVTGYDGSEKTQ